MNNYPKGVINTLRSKKFGILIKKGVHFYKIFDIQFYKNRNNKFAIFVNFPYFKKNQGILSKLTFPASILKVDKMSLIPKGKLVTHLVKYSHWEDGNTHFSQDGRVLTRIKNLSNPLNETADHIFTVMLQNLSGFQVKEESTKESSVNKIEIDFAFTKELPKTLKFTGWWFEAKNLIQNKQTGGPIVQMKFRDGIKSGFVLSPLMAYKYSNYVLFLTCEVMPLLTKAKGTHLSFIGGFDPKKISNDLTKDASFISFIYPVRGYKSLLSKIENIDYHPVSKK